MKTKTTFLLAILHASVPAMADILYVNNDTAYPADYRTFDDAFAAASAGDTIMLAASTTSYGSIAIVGKPVKLVGNKCINNNAPGQPARADEETTKIDYLWVGVTGGGGESRLLANGTIVESIDVLNLTASVWSDGCTFKNCNMNVGFVYGSGNLFIGCRFWGRVGLERHEDNTVTPAHVSPGTNNHFQNCITEDLETDSFTSGDFVNCVIGFGGASPTYGVAENSTVTLRSCIVDDSNIGNSGFYRVYNKFNDGGTRLHHCLIVGIGGGDPVPSLSAGLNNLTATSSASVFSDNFYNLLAGSPAIGSGEDGVDMGIFGGPTPYQWGGSPALPLINKLNILEANPTTGLTFRVEAEARD